MFRLYVMQDQWAIFGLFTGLGLVCAMILTYMMIWRPRAPVKDPKILSQDESLLRWYFSFMPWILQMTFLGAILFGVLYVVYTAYVPPNW